jgi:hypothetical protein
MLLTACSPGQGTCLSVLAAVDRGDGPEADVLATLADAPSVTMMAAVTALNGIVLQQVSGCGGRHRVSAASPLPSETYPLSACDS